MAELIKYAAALLAGVVIRVIVGRADWAREELGGEWVETDRKIGPGYTYDGVTLLPPQPYPSWTWDGQQWAPPTPAPEGNYVWDEDTQQWIEGEEL